MPREPRYEAQPFGSWEEVRRASEAARRVRDRSLILFACATGLRPQEWVALRWEDIDDEGVNVCRALKTPNAERRVLLTSLAREALTLLEPQRGRTFDVTLHGWRSKAWRTILTRAGLPYRPPSGMRDTYATLALAAGVRIEWIASQMGHASPATTLKHYARWTPEAHSSELEILNTALRFPQTSALTRLRHAPLRPHSSAFPASPTDLSRNDPSRSVTTCHGCGEAFSAKRRDALYCSAACRQLVYRERKRAGQGHPERGAPAS
jgi:hypothetical protein